MTCRAFLFFRGREKNFTELMPGGDTSRNGYICTQRCEPTPSPFWSYTDRWRWTALFLLALSSLYLSSVPCSLRLSNTNVVQGRSLGAIVNPVYPVAIVMRGGGR